jgi:Bacterial transcriptional activator domain
VGAGAAGDRRQTVQVYVSRLRRQLGEERLITRAPGHVLKVDPSELELARFGGPALADLAYEPFAQGPIAHLEEPRWAALEQRIDADLARGRQAELVGEPPTLFLRRGARPGDLAPAETATRFRWSLTAGAT